MANPPARPVPRKIRKASWAPKAPVPADNQQILPVKPQPDLLAISMEATLKNGPSFTPSIWPSASFIEVWPKWAETTDWNIGNNYGKSKRPLEAAIKCPELGAHLPRAASSEKASSGKRKLPELTTELEKELLSGVFAQWQEEIDQEDSLEERAQIMKERRAAMTRYVTAQLESYDPESDAPENWMCFRGGVTFR
ncbi:hypothetical protein BV898_12246 [Hypsibius exemplaris]|uniref:Uncharacterized protein n=1 Tax=Hypsibius exemplaris TaxID=2072580 RepID=A0A1W0WE85_HYPEX|nr:hypothetical protein BV898_12246 [Hypsibius exemplaris]